MWGAYFIICGIKLSTAGTLTAIAFLIAEIVLYFETTKRGFSFTQFFLILIISSSVAVLGAALLSALEFQYSLTQIIQNQAGSSHIGGFLLVVPSIMIIAKWQRLPSLKVLDAAVLSWCAGYTIGRLVCFFDGDGCYGIETSSIFGMTFPNGIVPSYVPVYPTPLFESFYSLVILGVFYYLYDRKNAGEVPDGRIFFGASSWMFACRFAVEYIRTNPKYAGLSLAQWLCIPLTFGFSAANCFLRQKKSLTVMEKM
ncbi:MAG TPA: prolipoprotein diacylglyceryl transferase family protein [Candidatus Kapabacteria bacterium]|jgi:phosphatidylglycerol:prolipoprotein diacylglycerol transferase|nr:prolipoprotein diacylglyceryl transferase family protein [Candidatus Kapabacteria bacterium]